MAYPLLSKTCQGISRQMYTYPKVEKQNVNLSVADCAAGDFNWMRAKQTLNKSLKGRHIVEYTENNLNTKSKFGIIKLI